MSKRLVKCDSQKYIHTPNIVELLHTVFIEYGLKHDRKHLDTFYKDSLSLTNARVTHRNFVTYMHI